MAVAVITGASRGFGKALATDLAADGWDVVVDARDGAALTSAAAEIAAGAAPGARVRPVAGNIADATHRAELVDAARELGGIDLLVNNASLLGPSPQPALADYPLDVLESVYRVNVFAPLALSRPRSRAPRRGTAPSSTSRPTPRSRATRVGAATDRRRPPSNS